MKHSILRGWISVIRDEHIAEIDEKVMDNPEGEKWEALWAEYGMPITRKQGCLAFNFPKGFLPRLESIWGLKTPLLIKKMVVPAPHPLLNALAAEKMRNRFDELPGEFNADGRLRVDSEMYPQGVLVPIQEDKKIVGLRVYRHPGDRENFIL